MLFQRRVLRSSKSWEFYTVASVEGFEIPLARWAQVVRRGEAPGAVWQPWAGPAPGPVETAPSCGSWASLSSSSCHPNVGWHPGLPSACAHPQEGARGWGCPCASAAQLLAGWAMPGWHQEPTNVAAAFPALRLPVVMVWCPSSFAKGQLHPSGSPIAAALVREGPMLHCPPAHVLFRKTQWIEWVNSSFFFVARKALFRNKI